MKGGKDTLVQRSSRYGLMEMCNFMVCLGVSKSFCVAGVNVTCKRATGNEAKEIGRNRP